MNSDNLKELDNQLRALYASGCLANELGKQPEDGEEMLEAVVSTVKTKILQLFQDYAMGCVPPARATLPDDDAFNLGWNECRQDILDNLKGKK